MRRHYLVCYDIRDDRRLRLVHRIMQGFGDPVQYSVFLCELSGRERIKLRSALLKAVDTGADSVLVIDLGGSTDVLTTRWERLGSAPDLSERSSIIV